MMDSIDKKINEVCQRVCDYFNIKDVGRLFSSSKVNNIEKLADARSFAIYILHVDEKVSAYRLSVKFKRTPRAIFWHVNKVDKQIKWHESVRETYNELCKNKKK